MTSHPKQVLCAHEAIGPRTTEQKMTKDERALKIERGLSCSLQAARIDYEVARSQLALDYDVTRLKLVAEAKAYAASLGIDPSTIWVPVPDSTHTMEGVRHD